MSSESQTNLRYVAHFDILGFRSAVLRNVDEAWGALSDLRVSMDRRETQEYQIATTREYIARRVKTFIFSDTVVAYTVSGAYQDLLAILVATAELFKDSLARCVPVRGGIAFGDFRFNLNLNLFAGPALIEAYELGESAQWLGIVVTEEVATRYKLLEEKGLTIRAATGQPLLTQWEVPTKVGVETRWVVDWPAICSENFKIAVDITAEQWYEAFVPLFGDLQDLPVSAQVKHQNTVDFVNSSRRITQDFLKTKGRRAMSRWFHYRFRIVWPEADLEPRLWIDVLLLDTVVREVVNLNRAEVTLWRVHRSWRRKDDNGQPSEVGHQFSLLLFTDEETADRVDRSIAENAILKEMRKANLLRDYFLEKESGEDIGKVEGTSDKNWSMEVQRAWPYYIMGVSEMLLDLVAHCKAGEPTPEFGASPDAVVSFYRGVNNQLINIWQNEGNHAFLHHLNALFGYVPLIVPANAIKAQLVSF